MTGLASRFRRAGITLAALAAAGVLVLAILLGQQASVLYLILAGGALGFVLLLQSPELGLVAMAGLSFTLPLTFGTGTEVALTPPAFLIPAVALAWLVDGLRRGSVSLPASRTVLPLLLFVGSGLLSLLAGNIYWDPLVPRPGNLLSIQLGQWGIFVLSAGIYLLGADLGTRGRWLEVATWVFLAAGTVVVVEFYAPPLRRALGWSSGLMASRSMFWTWLAALATGQVTCNPGLRRSVRLGLIALVVAAAYVMWFVQQDWISGWVPFTVAAFTVVWLRVWRQHRMAGLLMLAASVILAVMIYPLLFVHAGGEQELQVSWGGREKLYQAVLNLANRRPIFGLGIVAYRHYGYTQSLSMGYGRAFYQSIALSSHNNYIDIYAQMGLVGLGLFLWFLVEVGRLGWRLMPRFQGDFEEGYVYGALGGLAGTLVAMMLADWFLPFVYNIGFPGFRTSALAWMFLGGLVALEQRARREGGMG